MITSAIMIPAGWRYIGDKYSTKYRTGSYSNQSEAEEDLISLKHTYKNETFDIMPDTTGDLGIIDGLY